MEKKTELSETDLQTQSSLGVPPQLFVQAATPRHDQGNTDVVAENNNSNNSTDAVANTKNINEAAAVSVANDSHGNDVVDENKNSSSLSNNNSGNSSGLLGNYNRNDPNNSNNSNLVNNSSSSISSNIVLQNKSSGNLSADYHSHRQHQASSSSSSLPRSSSSPQHSPLVLAGSGVVENTSSFSQKRRSSALAQMIANRSGSGGMTPDSDRRSFATRTSRSSKVVATARKRQVIRTMDEDGKLATDNVDALEELPSSLYVFEGTNPIRLFMIHVTQNWWFQNFILFCIVFNAVLLGIDQPAVTWPDRVQDFLYVTDMIFTVVFAIEMVIKIIALGFMLHEGAYLRNGWNVLDFFIVVASIANLSSNSSNLSALRVVRVLRPLRSVSRIPELRILIQSLLRSMPQVADNLLLFLFLLIIFAVVGVQIWGGKLSQVCFAVFNSSSSWFPQVGSNLTRVHPVRRCGGNYECEAHPIPNTTSIECAIHENLFYPQFLNFDNFYVAALYVFKLMVLDNWTDDINHMIDSIGYEMVIYILFVTILGFYCACNLFFAVLSSAYSSVADSGGVDSADAVTDSETRDAATWIDVTRLDPVILEDIAMSHLAEEQQSCFEFCCGEAEQEENENENQQEENENGNKGTSTQTQTQGTSMFHQGEQQEEQEHDMKASEAGIFHSTTSDDNILPSTTTGQEEASSSSSSLTTLKHQHNSNNNNKNDKNNNDVDNNDDEMPKLERPTYFTIDEKICSEAIEMSDDAFGCVDNIPLELTAEEITDYVTNVVRTQRAEFERIRIEATEERHAAANLFAIPKTFRKGRSDDRHIIRCVVGWLVGHRITELVMLIVTLLNTVVLALDHHDISADYTYRLDVISVICTAMFTLEIVMKLFAFGFVDTLTESFNALDFIIVLESLIQYIISGSIASSGLAALRVLRTLRVLKLLTMFPSLQLIVRGVLHSMSSIGYLCLLILLQLYVFAILGMQIFGTDFKAANPEEILGFGTTYESFLIAFVVLTGDSWTDRMRAAMSGMSQELRWIPVFYFVLLFFLGNFVLVNLMVAIILDHMQELMDVLEQARSTEVHPPYLVLPPGFLIPAPRSVVLERKRSKKNLWSSLTVDKESGAVGLKAGSSFQAEESSQILDEHEHSCLSVSGNSPGSQTKSPRSGGGGNEQLAVGFQDRSGVVDLKEDSGNLLVLKSPIITEHNHNNNNYNNDNDNINNSGVFGEETGNSNDNANTSNINSAAPSRPRTSTSTQQQQRRISLRHQASLRLITSPVLSPEQEEEAKKQREERQKHQKQAYNANAQNVRIDSIELEDTNFFDKLQTHLLSKLWGAFLLTLEPEKIKASSEPSLLLFEIDNPIRAGCLYLHSLPAYNLVIFTVVVINVVFLFLENPSNGETLATAVFVADVVVAGVFLFDMITKIIAFGFWYPDATEVALEGQSGNNIDETLAAEMVQNIIDQETANTNNNNNNNNNKDDDTNQNENKPPIPVPISGKKSNNSSESFRSVSFKDNPTTNNLSGSLPQESSTNISSSGGSGGDHVMMSPRTPSTPGTPSLQRQGTISVVPVTSEAVVDFTVGAYCRDAWNVVDGIVTIVSIVGLFDANAKFLRSLRTFRLLARIEGARIILEAIVASLPMVLNGLFLSLLAFMMFGVLGVQLYKGSMYICNDKNVTYRYNCTGYYVGEETDAVTGLLYSVNKSREWKNSRYHFDDFPNALLTLFVVVAGDSWSFIMYQGMDVVGENYALSTKASPGNAMFYVGAYIVGNIFCLNMIIGILLNFFQRQKEIQDGSAFLTETQRKFLRARQNIEQTWLPVDEDVLTPLDNDISRFVHRMLTYMWWELRLFCCGTEEEKHDAEIAAEEEAARRIAASAGTAGSLRIDLQHMQDEDDAVDINNQLPILTGQQEEEQQQEQQQKNPLSKEAAVEKVSSSFTNNNDESQKQQQQLKRSNEMKKKVEENRYHTAGLITATATSSEQLQHQQDSSSQQQAFATHFCDSIAPVSLEQEMEMLATAPSPSKQQQHSSAVAAAAATGSSGLQLHDSVNTSGSDKQQQQPARKLSVHSHKGASQQGDHQNNGDEENNGDDENSQIETSIAQAIFYAIITLNFVINAIEYYNMPEDTVQLLFRIELACLILFSVEWALKVTAYGFQLITASTTVIGWFLFDSLIIIFGFVGIAFPGLRFLSFMRALRLMKLLRGTGVEKMLLMLVRSFRQIVNVLTVLLLTYFVFAVAGVALFGEGDFDQNSFFINDNRNFKDVPRALLILFQASTTDGWGDFAADISDSEFCDANKSGSCISRPLANGFFIIFMCFVTWIALQMFVAILIEVFDNFRTSNADDDPLKAAFYDLRAKYDLVFGDGARDVHVYDFIDHLHEMPPSLTQFHTMDPGPLERLKLLGTLPIPVKSDMTISFRDVVLAFAYRHFHIDVRSSTDFLTDVIRGTVFGLAFSAFQCQAVRIIQAEWMYKKMMRERHQEEKEENIIVPGEEEKEQKKEEVVE